MQKLVISLVVLAAVAAGGWYMFQADRNSSQPETNDTLPASGPVAIVNGENIDRTEFDELQVQITSGQGIDMETLDEETKTQIRSQVLDILISQALLQQAVDLSDIEVSEEEIDEEIETIKGQFEGDEMFAQVLEMQGLTEETLRTQIREDIAAQAYLDRELDLQSFTATEEEIQAEYDLAVAEYEDVPPFEEVRDEVETFVIQKKQQDRVALHIEELRNNAEIEVLI